MQNNSNNNGQWAMDNNNRLKFKFQILAAILTILLLALLSIFLFLPKIISADARAMIIYRPEVPFVQIENEGVMLYNRQSNGHMRPVTSLPQSYFALVTGEHGEFYEVLFYDLTGFVRKNAVTKVDFEPVTKFATGTLNVITDANSINIRLLPEVNDTNIIGQASRGSQLVFYGTIQGTPPQGHTNSTWYFIRFINSAHETAWGYIHAANVASNSIPPNNIEKVMVYADDPPVFNPGETLMPDYIMIITIVALCVPVAIIMLLIFKKPKNTKKTPRSF